MSLITLILIVLFAGIAVWAFSKERKARFDQDAKIPFDDGKD